MCFFLDTKELTIISTFVYPYLVSLLAFFSYKYMKQSHSITLHASKTMQICGYFSYMGQIIFRYQRVDISKLQRCI